MPGIPKQDQEIDKAKDERFIGSFTIHGSPISKKNQRKRCPRGSYQSPAWREYHKNAMAEGFAFTSSCEHRDLFPVNCPQQVHVKILVYPANRKNPDLSGVMESIADLIEIDKKFIKKVRKGIGVIQDDKQILNWDGSRMMEPDKENPRVEVFIWLHEPEPGELVLRTPAKKKKNGESK